ncbi:MAG: DUF4411 family protein [Bacteroidales bacterium]|jgi:hypothetical protein|nr:DUF4411 family protein [Bacteroidales bacterium]
MSVFIVDSNFFIQAHRANYPLDIAITFWKKVKELADNGSIVSIDKVKHEIYQNDDELKSWCIENLPNDFFKDSSEVIEDYTQVVNWAVSKSEHYIQRAMEEFLDADEADAWIIAYALKNDLIITTHEKSQPDSKKKIKIPEPCNALGVTFVDTIEMLRRLNTQF